MKLNDTDARALDMVLSTVDAAAAPTASADFINRVNHVDQLLKLLDYLPVAEPPEGLVAKTLQRVEEARTAAPAGAPRAATTSATAAGIGSFSPIGDGYAMHMRPKAGSEDEPSA